jgi:hypothetical protein
MLVVELCNVVNTANIRVCQLARDAHLGKKTLAPYRVECQLPRQKFQSSELKAVVQGSTRTMVRRDCQSLTPSAGSGSPEGAT